MSLTFILRLTVILLSAAALGLGTILGFAEQLPLPVKIACAALLPMCTYLAGNLPSLIETERAQNAINTFAPLNTMAKTTLLPTEPNVVVPPKD